MQIEFIAVPDEKDLLGAIATWSFDGELTPAAAALDRATSGAVARAVSAGRFKGAKGQTLEIVAPAGISAQRIVVAGLGAKAELNELSIEAAAAQVFNTVKNSGSEVLTLYTHDGGSKSCAHAALAVRLAAYRFDRYRTTEGQDKKPTVATVRIVAGDPASAVAAFEPLAALADGMTFTRDLVSEPPNILFPAEFAKRVKALERLGLSVEVLGEAEMEKLGMGSLLGVGQGSRRESQLVVIQWKGGAKDAQPIAFVGKGVCFDTGGISLKQPEGMEDMKWDMGGAGAVAGLMHTLASRKAKANVVGILGLVENMPDGNAQRPGDIVTSMSGQTIEVINTDAEGRLVLADALWYCQDRFKPRFMVDLATLTGAIIISLGNDYSGLFSNNDELSAKLLSAGEATGDALWRMPMPSAYEKKLESMAADMKNIGDRYGGSITAALFIQKFVNGLPWAHLDIAGTAWRKPSSVPTIPDGATGYGVRLLDRLVADNYEA